MNSAFEFCLWFLCIVGCSANNLLFHAAVLRDADVNPIITHRSKFEKKNKGLKEKDKD